MRSPYRAPAAKQVEVGHAGLSVLQVLAEEPGRPADPERRFGDRIAFQELLHLAPQLGRHALVGVDAEHPITGRLVQRPLFLDPIARPVRLEHETRVLASDRHRAVRASAVQHDDLVSQVRDRLQTVPDAVLLVADDDDDRQGVFAGHWNQREKPAYCVASTAWQPRPGDGQQSSDWPSFWVMQKARSRSPASVGNTAQAAAPTASARISGRSAVTIRSRTTPRAG